MTDFIKFPKIRQFRDIIKHVKTNADFKGMDADGNAMFEHTEAYPILNFEGTVKLHGSNAGIVFDEDRKMHIQSRTREISVLNDNAGFAAFVDGRKHIFLELANALMIKHQAKTIYLWGEFCGVGIQKGVALNELPKTFVMFDSFSYVNKNHVMVWQKYTDYK